MLKPHDPTRFERVLRQRIAHPQATGLPQSDFEPETTA
jgi:hypothetical protein